jgi:hypothetical protein
MAACRPRSRGNPLLAEREVGRRRGGEEERRRGREEGRNSGLSAIPYSLLPIPPT